MNKMKKKINWKRLIVILFLVILAIGVYIDIRGSFLEYKELGEEYITILKTNLIYKYSVTIVSFVVMYFIMYFATRGIKKGVKVFFEEEKKAYPKLPNKSISLIVSMIVSIIAGAKITPQIILYASNVSFEQTDGIFNLDISFYMFAEPLIKILLLYLIGIFVFLILYSVVYYIIVFNKYFEGIEKETLKKNYIVKHIIRYVRCITILFAIYTLVRTLDIVFSNFVTTDSGLKLVGAGITDVSIRVWGNIILAIIIILSVFGATINFKEGKRTKAVKKILLVPTYLVAMFVVMVGFDVIFVKSNEYDKEKQYIEKNISYTKDAYGINCEEKVVDYTGTITVDEVEKNKNIIDNAVIIDKDTVLQNLNYGQTGKGYYTYSTAGISKYYEDGICKLVYNSPREIVSNKRTYNSKTFEYTHGYGTIMTSATSTDEDGGIEYIQNKVEDNQTKVPQIYYGLETNNTVVTNSKNQDEYDYTDSKGTEYTASYEGDSGIKLNFVDRLILGAKKADVSLAFSNQVTKDSKILINRNIIERAKLVLSNSNIIYDENPYIVEDEDGHISWVLDAYTISSNYPYSTYTTIQHNGRKLTVNYIRNSIKVIIDAYDGSMKFYITDTTDPIAMAYHKIFPNLFEDTESKIPEKIANYLVYPKFLYDVQAEILSEYHNTKPEVLYRGDDNWDISSYITNQSSKNLASSLESYYTMVKNKDKENIGLIQIYTSNGNQNLASYLVGTVEEGENKLRINRLASDESIIGLVQLDNKIMQDENIKSEIEELNVTGAKVTKNMMVIPIENTILYVEKIYQTKTNESNIPELKKIIVASGNKVAIGDNLEKAIENIVSQYATSIDTYTTEDIDGIIQSVIKANKNLSQSMESNDWELMGTDIKKLQELIDLLEKVQDGEKNKQEASNVDE